MQTDNQKIFRGNKEDTKITQFVNCIFLQSTSRWLFLILLQIISFY